jgi:nitrite reductase/ring-hydroxylating ferredoxin subunit
VCAGTVIPRLSGPQFGIAISEQDFGMLVCPWHRWEYDLKSGLCLRDKRYRLKKYRAWEEEGRMMVDVGGQAKED